MKFANFFTSSALTIISVSSIVDAQLSQCPTKEDRIQTSDGSIYAACGQTDYQGTTTALHSNVANWEDCTKLCNQTPQCAKAGYEGDGRRCHLKATDGVTLVNAPRFTSVRFLSKPAPLSTVEDCPVGAKNMTTSTGAIMSICPNTDYEGNTVRNSFGVASIEACAAQCSEDTQCSRAVFNQENGGCWLKAAPQFLRWIVNPGPSTIQKVSMPAMPPAGSSITTCPGGSTDLTSNGVKFATCRNADFAAPSIDITSNVPTVEECAARCTSISNCVQASYNIENRVCHIKGNLTSPPWVYNVGTISLQVLLTTPSPPTSSSTNTPAVPSQTNSPLAIKGRWSDVIPLPVIPVGAFVVPEQPTSNRILVYSSWLDGSTGYPQHSGQTQFADLNTATGAVSKRTVVNTRHDMFCPGMSTLPNGKVMITGGANAEASSIYDPKTNDFTRGADMKIPRGYQTSTTLSNGKVFTIGGSWSGAVGGKSGEIYDPVSNTWTLLDGAKPEPLLTDDNLGMYREDNHAWLYGWRNGWVFQAGPSKAMNWYNTANGGSSTPAGTRTNTMDQMCGVNVMYDVGKILSAGGSQDYSDSDATAEAKIITINQPGVAAQVESISSMAFPRAFASGVVLPDGKVLVTGGQRRAIIFTDLDSALTPELWDPKTRQWTQLAPMAVPRNYHSVGVLLADGRVFVGGGGLCTVARPEDDANCDRRTNHYDGEIFTPPYLFNGTGQLAPRPVISSVSAASFKVGASITVQLQSGLQGATFSLVRIGTATHTINSDQRRVPLTSVQANGGGKYTIKLPSDSGVVIPGPWFLFALSSQGVPSIARTVYIGN